MSSTAAPSAECPEKQTVENSTTRTTSYDPLIGLICFLTLLFAVLYLILAFNCTQNLSLVMETVKTNLLCTNQLQLSQMEGYIYEIVWRGQLIAQFKLQFDPVKEVYTMVNTYLWSLYWCRPDWQEAVYTLMEPKSLVSSDLCYFEDAINLLQGYWWIEFATLCCGYALLALQVASVLCILYMASKSGLHFFRGRAITRNMTWQEINSVLCGFAAKSLIDLVVFAIVGYKVYINLTMRLASIVIIITLLLIPFIDVVLNPLKSAASEPQDFTNELLVFAFELGLIKDEISEVEHMVIESDFVDKNEINRIFFYIKKFPTDFQTPSAAVYHWELFQVLVEQLYEVIHNNKSKFQVGIDTKLEKIEMKMHEFCNLEC